MITDLAHLRRMSEQALLYNSYFHTFAIYLEIRRLFLKIIFFKSKFANTSDAMIYIKFEI